MFLELHHEVEGVGGLFIVKRKHLNVSEREQVGCADKEDDPLP